MKTIIITLAILLAQQAYAKEEFGLESLMDLCPLKSPPAEIVELLTKKEKKDLDLCQQLSHYKKGEIKDFFGAVVVHLNNDGKDDYLVYPRKYCENMFGAHAIPYWIALSSSTGYKIVHSGSTDAITILDTKTSGVKDIVETYGQEEIKYLFTGKMYKLAPSCEKKPALQFHTNIHDSQEAYSIKRQKIPPIPVGNNRLLVTAGGKLTMLDENKKVVWEWGEADFIAAPPIIDSRGTIYGIAYDGFSFALSADGKRKWMRRLNGRANYDQIKLYGDDQYLMLQNLSGYCDKGKSCPNTLEAYQCAKGVPGEDINLLWTVDFPAGADVEVWGKQIFAVTYKKNLVEIQEIEPSAE